MSKWKGTGFLPKHDSDSDKGESRVCGYIFGVWTPVGMGDYGVITVLGNGKVYSRILEVNGGERMKYKITGKELKNKNKNKNQQQLNFSDWMK